ncbi:MAG: hypothetical protein M3Z36_01875 [Acidobacteriota bacterium]|nr:hypothetical protein [Acidobacteriota bacterium]
MIRDLIQRARRRFLWNEMFSALAFAASLITAALVLLLVFGTQIMDWRILGALSIAGFGIFLARTIRRVPDEYRIAVLIDRRADLNDSLSTALYFDEPARQSPANNDMRAAQRATAESLLPAIDLTRAIPFTVPKAIYAMAALSLVASSLFALRYGIDRRLDLRTPLTTILMDTFGFAAEPPPQLARRKSPGPGKKAELLNSLGIAVPQAERKQPGDLDKAPDSALDTIGIPEVNNEKAEGGKKGGQGKAAGSEKADGEKGDAEASEQGSPANGGKNSSDDPSGSRDGPQQGEQSGGKQANSGENSSLMAKLRDAVSNMLSKARSQPENAGGQKPSNAQGKQQAQSQKPSGNEKGAPGQGQQAGGKESSDAQDGQQAGDSENDQNAPGKGGGKSADQQTASQPGSGIGKQDGAKDLKAAEQLAAMGKLSEIIGKRSANVSGEITVEVESGPQQLHTAYSQRSAKHGESTGEVSRDEVPVALQSYVQQYFEEIRKVPAPAKAKRAEAPSGRSTP